MRHVGPDATTPPPEPRPAPARSRTVPADTSPSVGRARSAEPATVLARLGAEVLVDIDGHARLVTNHVVPDIHAGDEVLVGVGTILARVSSAEAHRLRGWRADRRRGPS